VPACNQLPADFKAFWRCTGRSPEIVTAIDEDEPGFRLRRAVKPGPCAVVNCNNYRATHRVGNKRTWSRAAGITPLKIFR
jgi:hypothetical protein